MAYLLDGAGQARLDRYFDAIGGILRHKSKRACFALYAMGLLSDVERKSVEPIAALASGDPALCRAYHEKLLRFVGIAEWSDRDVRAHAVAFAVEEMTREEPVTDWIVDDTGFPKQGKKSPGVQRQYSGTLGKTGNCQLAVSVTVATETSHMPVGMDLYLPTSWTEDRSRCQAAHIPDDVVYRPKWRIALDLIEDAVKAGTPRGVLLGDSAYGDVGAFREGVRALGFDYALDVKAHTRVVLVCGENGEETSPMRVDEVAEILGAHAYHDVTWREGTKGSLRAFFAMVRVRVAFAKGKRGEEQWLVIEKATPNGPAEHYVLATLPKTMSPEQLVRRIKQRWRTERVYQDLKGELGLDHYEGRSYVGWQHHVSCVLACYAFLVAERARAFPPSARGARHDHALGDAA